MASPYVIVSISTVGWRRANFMALLNDLAVQTTSPSEVLLTFDDCPPVEWADLPRQLQSNGRTLMRRFHTPTGPGARWRRLQHRREHTNDIVMTIDDDFRIDSDYIERALWELRQCDERSALSWSGARMRDGDYTSWTGTESFELLSLSAGSSVIQLRDLDGLFDYSFIDDYFKVGGDDEALVSYHLYKKGVRMWRPPGAAPLRSVDTLANDPRAAGQQHGRERVRARQRLHELGWEPYQLPPSLRKQEWKKKPWE